MDFLWEWSVARWIFFRLLGAIYLIAFLSFWVQAVGLIGQRGILPVREYLEAFRRLPMLKRISYFPTLFWIRSSDAALHGVCALGTLGSLLLLMGWNHPALFFLLWLLYLSVTVAGQDFLSFQWDVLLLETGFLAIFFTGGSTLILFLLWWLLFRLVFGSGVVKLSVRDRTWLNLTALDYHFYTQPLPTIFGYYFHQLPSWFHRFSTLMVYVLEIPLPLLIFGTDKMRLIAFAGIMGLQLIIFLTGNYNFFNLLPMALAVLLLPDSLFERMLDPAWVQWIQQRSPASPPHPIEWGFQWALTGVILLLTIPQVIRSILPSFLGPLWIRKMESALLPFRSLNSYGLFRVMTTSRPEIIIEGSHDGVEWKEYRLKYKPHELNRPPPWVQPHQPRLDWQMWFAALSSYYVNGWIQSLLARLLEGSKDVLALMARNPFPDKPPQYVRALLYDYTFTTWKEKRSTGAWWKRKLLGQYSPVLSTRSDY